MKSVLYLILFVWVSGFAAPFVSNKLFIPDDYCDICSLDNPYCSCSSEEMNPDCPVMQDGSKGLLLIFPVVLLEKTSGESIHKQILEISLQFDTIDLGAQEMFSVISGLRANPPPIIQNNNIYKIVEVFLI